MPRFENADCPPRPTIVHMPAKTEQRFRNVAWLRGLATPDPCDLVRCAASPALEHRPSLLKEGSAGLFGVLAGEGNTDIRQLVAQLLFRVSGFQ
jgi:hypothetical protein